MTASLLPPNSTALERAIEGAAASRLEVLATDGVRTIGDPTLCPVAALPHLAWSRSVDVLDPAASEATKRRVIATAPAVHRIKGTPVSVENALASMGIAAQVEERVGARRYDGQTRHDGIAVHGPADGWALYRIILGTPLRNDQVVSVRRLLETTAPKHCELLSLDYQEVANLYDGRSRYDGAYNHGSAS